MKCVYTGIESSGKSLQLSRTAANVLARNKKWLAITGVPRKMAFNQDMSEEFVNEIRDAGLEYIRFKHLDDILPLEEIDIFIDELIKFFPASGSNSLGREQLDFITQGAKTGVHLYAASQDFSQVHKQFRLLVNEVYVITKILGSKRPMKTAPPVKRIWGLCMMRKCRPSSFKGDNETLESEGIPGFFFIREIDTKRFDTSFKIPPTKLPIKIVRRQEYIGYDDEGVEIVHHREMWV